MKVSAKRGERVSVRACVEIRKFRLRDGGSARRYLFCKVGRHTEIPSHGRHSTSFRLGVSSKPPNERIRYEWCVVNERD